MHSRVTLDSQSMARTIPFLFVFFLAIAFPVYGIAETPTRSHGLVTSAPCPYSCMDEGLTKDVCRERQLGTICEVEDLTQAPGHRSMIRVPKADVDNMSAPQRLEHSLEHSSAPMPGRRGLVTSSHCPYSCKDAGLTVSECQEMQVGDVCQIEDFTQAPGHRSLVRVPRES